MIRHSEPQLQRCFFSRRSDLGFLHSDFAEEVLTPAHPIRSITVSDRYSLFRMISASSGYGLGSGELYEDWAPADIRSVPVRRTQNLDGSTMTIGWIYLSGQEISPDAETFLRLCQESIRRHPGTLKHLQRQPLRLQVNPQASGYPENYSERGRQKKIE